jgi:hypothetical protein
VSPPSTAEVIDADGYLFTAASGAAFNGDLPGSGKIPAMLGAMLHIKFELTGISTKKRFAPVPSRYFEKSDNRRGEFFLFLRPAKARFRFRLRSGRNIETSEPIPVSRLSSSLRN